MTLARQRGSEIGVLLSDPAVSVVSFDVFDTLLRRRVMDPNHVFWLLEQALLRRGFDHRWVQHFGHARIHAWHLSVRHAQLRGRQDTNFGDIYAVLGSVLPGARPYLDEISTLEMDLERSLLEAYQFGVRLFQEALAAGKRVVLCSDQYLPKDFIEDRLRASGVAGYEHFFLSGELGVLKITGALYDWISVRLGVGRDQILHIGDTEETDYRVAQRKGLRAALIPRSVDLSGHAARHSSVVRHPSLSSVASAMFLHRQADCAESGSDSSESYLEYLGYALLGPLFVGLSRWLADRLTAGEIDRLWFLSRDGEGLSKAFELLYPQLADKTAYVYASRRLLAYSTGELSAAEVFRHFCHIDTPDTSARAFLEAAFGDIGAGKVGARFAADETLGRPGVRERLAHAIEDLIESGDMASSPRANTIHAYYRSQLSGAKSLGVFDVGWRGNLQRALNRVLTDDGVRLRGFYLGHIFEHEILKDHIDCESFAFDLNFPSGPFHDLFSCLWVTEFLFASTHLSVVDLEEEDGRYRPVFEDPTPTKDDLMAAGRVLQEAALRFVNDSIAWDHQLVLQLADHEQLVHSLREFVVRPSPGDAHELAGRKAVIGIDEAGGDPLIAPLPPSDNVEEVRRAFEASAWKAGFRAAVGQDVVDMAFSPAQMPQRHRIARLLGENSTIRRLLQTARGDR